MRAKTFFCIGIIMVTVTTARVSAPSPGPRHADWILTNGNIWTVNSRQPKAQAVAVAGGRILFVGAAAEAAGLAGPATKVIDLMGKTVLPGFNDSHVHFMSGGFHLLGVDLRDVT